MPTQQVSFSEQQAEFIRRSVDSGAFKDADDVMRAALDALERESANEREKFIRLREAIDVATAELDRGEGIVIPPDQIGSFARRRVEVLIRNARQ